MGVSRRDFLKLTGATAVAGAVGGASEAEAFERENRLKGATVTTSVCRYCAVGCGMLVYQKDGKIIQIEGDPEHPINQGSLCPKGASVMGLVNNPKRLQKPKYRAPGASDWKDVEWSWALDEIAKRVKKARDASFVEKNEKGQTVNRTNALASVGSAAMDNEECYLYQKWLRSLGLVAIEHQARI
jgi:formate dehydrogenase major subunit